MKKRTSKEVFAAALLRLSREMPLERITVTQLVEASGLSLQTFYNHFRDKDDLILWLHRSNAERLFERLSGQSYRFRDLITDSVRFYAENAFYLRGCLGGSSLSRTAMLTAEISFQFLRSYLLRRSGLEELPEDTAVYLRMYIISCLYIFAEWPERYRELSPERLAQLLENGMPEGLRPWLLG